MIREPVVIDVTIIIVNYKTIKLLIDAINSLLDKTERIVYEIIVVDNHSEDDTEQILKEYYCDRVVYLPLLENMGFGRANNEGVKIATGRNIFFLNPDTVLINNAVEILSDYLDKHLDTAIVGGNLYTVDMRPNTSFSRVLPGIFDEIDKVFFRMFSRIRFGRSIYFNYDERPLSVGFICGADLMIRREVFDQMEGFDPDFFMYYEETELSWRIKRKGYKIVNVPQAKIIHLEGKSFNQKYERELKIFRSRRIYYEKTHSLFYQVLIDINYFFFFIVIAWIIGFVLNLKTFRLKTRQRLKVLREVSKNR